MIELEALEIEAGNFRVPPLALEVPAGQYFVLLGPSGHGKSVILETIAGLRRPAAGRILLDGREVTGLPPERRAIGYVCQRAALFPHLCVFENVAFPLRVRGRGEREIEAKVGEAASLVGAGHLLDRMPGALSGGETQRVAIARALASEPKILLFDEPLASLDGPSRLDLRQVLRDVHDRLGTTTIHVDHDHDLAGALADRIGVLGAGRLLQVGPPDEVFRRPASEEVARFVGVRNLLDGEVSDGAGGGAATFRSGDLRLRVVTDRRGRARASLRPEEILVSAEPLQSSATNSIAGEIASLDPSGALVYVTVRAGASLLVALVLRPSAETLDLKVGRPVHLTFKASAVHVF